MTILLTLAGLALLLATLPLTLELLTLSLAAALPPGRLPTGNRPVRLAAIIPAHNEQKLITSCVQSLLAPPGVTPFVIAHNCTDATAAAAEAAGAHVLPLTESSGKGKGAALHHGFSEVLARGYTAALVIDADSQVTATLIPAVLAAFAAGTPAVQCRYLVANPADTPRTRLMSLALLGMNVLRPRGRTRLGLSCGIFGNGFALSAETLRQVPYTAGSVVEDLEYHLLLVRAGIPVTFLDNATVLGEMPDNSAAAATQRARWEGGRLLMRREHTPTLARAIAAGHLRFAEPLLDLLSLPLATQAALLLFTLVLSLLPLAIPAHSPLAAHPLPWLTAYATAGLLTLILYVVTAACLAPAPAKTLKALLAAPAYLIFKAAMLPATRRAARRNATWVRTDRN